MQGVPFGHLQPMTQDRVLWAAEEVQLFVEWINSLDVAPAARRVLRTLVDMAAMADPRVLVTGRCAVRSYVAELGRRSVVRDYLDAVLGALMEAGYITMFPEPVFGSAGPGVVFRVLRPDVVLERGAGANLWPEDTKGFRKQDSGQHGWD
jgi:hypothetical protein